MVRKILLFFVMLGISDFGLIADISTPNISIYSGRWTWRARIEYQNDFIRCIFRDAKISPFLSKVSLAENENLVLVENCGPSIQKFEKTSIESKEKSFTFLCENPVPETASTPYWKTKGILFFPGNNGWFSLGEEIKILKKGRINFSSFNFDIHSASPIAAYIKSDDGIEKIELNETRDYKFEKNSIVIQAKNGIIGIHIVPCVKKGTSILSPVKSELCIQRKEKTTIGYLACKSDEIFEGEEISIGLNFYFFPTTEDVREVFTKMEAWK
ncbi:MAG: hypothetical protein N2115_00180 [bacterium]|nr:hypothetical protein [bacterium]